MSEDMKVFKFTVTSVEKDGQQRRHSETIREMCIAKGIFVTVATGKFEKFWMKYKIVDLES